MAGHFDQFEYNGKTIKATPFRRKQPKIYQDPTTLKKEN